MITNINLEFIIAITFLTNLVGTYIAKQYIEYRRPEQLRLVNTTVFNDKVELIENNLKLRGVKYSILKGYNERNVFHIYAYSKAESGIVYEILNKYNLKYITTENIG